MHFSASAWINRRHVIRILNICWNNEVFVQVIDEFTPKMSALHKGKNITFGEGPDCDIRATDIEVREGRGSKGWFIYPTLRRIQPYIVSEWTAAFSRILKEWG